MNYLNLLDNNMLYFYISSKFQELVQLPKKPCFSLLFGLFVNQTGKQLTKFEDVHNHFLYESSPKKGSDGKFCSTGQEGIPPIPHPFILLFRSNMDKKIW